LKSDKIEMYKVGWKKEEGSSRYEGMIIRVKKRKPLLKMNISWNVKRKMEQK